MAAFDPTTLSLSDYPLRAKYEYPSFDGMTAALGAALGLPPGVTVSHRFKGASWASWASGGGFTFPDRPLDVAMKVRGIVPHKRLGEALSVSFVALDGDRIVAWSEDHSFKPPRPATLAFVDASGAQVPVSDAIRAAVALHAAPAPAKAKPAKPAKPAADAAPEKPARGAKGAKAASVFVADTPITRLALSPDGTTIATSHVDSLVTLWSRDGAVLRKVKAGGGGMITVANPAFSPDGKRLAVGASALKLFDVATGDEQEAPAGPAKSQISSIQWTDAGLFVQFLTPKDVLLVRYDVAGAKKLGEWSWKRAPGVVCGAWVDGTLVHLPLGDLPQMVRLDLATGKQATLALPEPAVQLMTSAAGVWADMGARWTLLDRDGYAVRRELRVQPMRAQVDASGATFVAALDDGTAERFECLDTATGKVRARWSHAQVEGLEAYLAGLKEAGQSKDSRRYLDYSPTPHASGLAIGPAGEIVAATSWVIAVWAADGTPLVTPRV